MNHKIIAVTVFTVTVFGILALFFFGRVSAQSAALPEDQHNAPMVLRPGDVYLPIVVDHTAGASCDKIQEAIDELPANGGQVLISQGTFTCQSPIVIARDHVDVRGQGPSTVLRLADNADSPVVIIGDTHTPPAVTHRNIHLSDLSIDGNRDKQNVECWGGPCDEEGRYIRNNGITVRGASDVQIERIAVSGAISGGLVTEKGCERITVSDFTSSDNFFDGIAAYETENSIFSNLYLHDNQSAGLSLDIRFNNNIVSNAVMTNNGKQGIFMRDSRDNLFNAIQIRGSGEQGLFLAQVDAEATTPAAGNTFQGLVVSGSAQAGMRVNDASCENNLVASAQLTNNQACISEAVPGLVEQNGVICR